VCDLYLPNVRDPALSRNTQAIASEIIRTLTHFWNMMEAVLGSEGDEESYSG
jgi:hypothetical protein